MGRSLCRSWNAVGGREGNEDLAAAVVADGSCPAEADVDAAGESAQLVRMQWKVGRQHADARSLLMPFGHEVSDLPTDWRTSDQKLVAASVVGLQQHADCEPLAGKLDDARRRPDAAFEVEELGAGTGADPPFLDGSILCSIQR